MSENRKIKTVFERMLEDDKTTSLGKKKESYRNAFYAGADLYYNDNNGMTMLSESKLTEEEFEKWYKNNIK